MKEYYWLILVAILILVFSLTILFAISRKERRINQSDRNYLLNKWKEVLSAKKKYPSKAILDADKILDKTLEIMGYQGSVAEKLKKAKTRFSNNNAVWRAHKLRNKIAHELDFIPRDEDVDLALRDIRKGLYDLGLK